MGTISLFTGCYEKRRPDNERCFDGTPKSATSFVKMARAAQTHKNELQGQIRKRRTKHRGNELESTKEITRVEEIRATCHHDLSRSLGEKARQVSSMRT